MTDTLSTELVQAIPILPPHYTDDLMVCGVLVCTFIMALVFSDRKRYIAQLMKDFFLPRENKIEGVRTTNIAYLRAMMHVVGLISTSQLLTLYASDTSLDPLSHGMLWFVVGVAIALFYLLRMGLFAVTNRIFFDASTTTAWEQSYACWTILSGIPLYLLSVVVLFFNLSSRAILWSLFSCFVLLEVCLLYKAFHIFSGKKHGILQLFVYLCTLELIPLLVAGKTLVLFV